jgi:signal peptidase I
MKTWLKNNRGFLLLLLGLAFLRTAVADWNTIPSGSMRPTLLEGDVVLVNRLAYDVKLPLTRVSLARLGDPQRGDIVTVFSPKDGTRLIKRLVAVADDTVQMRAGVLVINGRRAEYDGLHEVVEPVVPAIALPATHAVEQLGGRRHAVQYFTTLAHGRSFRPLVVPPDSYFMLGDNRDNSEDSRFIGVVHRSQLIGRAERTLVSVDFERYGLPRLERFGSPLE